MCPVVGVGERGTRTIPTPTTVNSERVDRQPTTMKRCSPSRNHSLHDPQYDSTNIRLARSDLVIVHRHGHASTDGVPCAFPGSRMCGFLESRTTKRHGSDFQHQKIVDYEESLECPTMSDNLFRKLFGRPSRNQRRLQRKQQASLQANLQVTPPRRPRHPGCDPFRK